MSNRVVPCVVVGGALLAMGTGMRMGMAQQQKTPAQLVQEIDKLIADYKAQTQTPDPQPQPGTVVPPGTGLQAAITAAPAGATLLLAQGGVYVGGVKITKALTLETQGVTLPAGQRVALADAAKFARITTSANVPALDITGSNVTIRKLAVSGSVDTLILVGHGDNTQTLASQQPNNVVLDQLLVEGDPLTGAKRAVGLHGKNVTVSNSYMHQIRWPSDSTIIGGWNGEGPFSILNNYLSGSTMNILFGGSDAIIPGLIPSDILIEGNYMTYPPEWKGQPNSKRKNVIEFKVGRRITIRNNILENAWTDGQVGWCFLVTPMQDGGYEEVIIEDLLFEQNILRNCGGGFSLLGYSQFQATLPTQTSRRLTFRDNYIYNLDTALGDHGSLMQLGKGPIDVVFEHNTVQQNGNAFLRGSDSVPIRGFKFTGNLVNTTEPKMGLEYGTVIAGQSRGNQLSTLMPGAVISGNAFVKAHAIFKTNLPSNMWLAAPSEATYDAATGVATGVVAAYGRRLK